MKDSKKVLPARIMTIVEIVILSLFIISLFFPYGYSIIPIEFILGFDLFSGQLQFDLDHMARLTFPIIISLILLILIMFMPRKKDQKLRIVKWIIILIFVSYFVFIVIDLILNWESLWSKTVVIIALVSSLFLFLSNIILTKDNYLIIGNSSLAIIAIPVVDACVTFFPDETGGYILFSSFILLYLIGVVKLFFRQRFIE